MDTKALVTLCQKGNGQALSLLYENYSEKMLKVCLRYIPDQTIAQDLLHDGFVIIFTSIHSLRNPEKLEYLSLIHISYKVPHPLSCPN